MNPHTLDIGQTLLNNTLHAPWIGQPELKKTWLIIDDFLFFVRKQEYVLYPTLFTLVWKYNFGVIMNNIDIETAGDKSSDHSW